MTPSQGAGGQGPPAKEGREPKLSRLLSCLLTDGRFHIKPDGLQGPVPRVPGMQANPPAQDVPPDAPST